MNLLSPGSGNPKRKVPPSMTINLVENGTRGLGTEISLAAASQGWMDGLESSEQMDEDLAMTGLIAGELRNC